MFDVCRFGEEKDLQGELCNQGYNALCLCPNCHALMKQGSGGLKGIIEQAKQAAAGKVKGDCYSVGINIAGIETRLYCTAEHVAKIEAFVKRPESKAR